MDTPIPLQYAQSKANLGKPIALVIVFSIALAVWVWGPGAWHRITLHYWQYTCTHFSAAPDKVVYEANPAVAAALLKLPEYHPIPGRSPSPACFDPDCLEKWRMIDGIRSKLPQKKAIFFLGERTAPSGQHKLLSLAYDPQFVGEFRQFDVFSKDLTTGDWGLASLDVSGLAPLPMIEGGPGDFEIDPKLRIYAGQSDPSDPTHFTVRYRMWDQDDVMDGKLVDGGIVTLTPRDPPIKPQPSRF